MDDSRGLQPTPRSMERFSRAYHRWNLTHAAVVTALVIGIELLPGKVPVFAGLAVWISGALTVLFALGHTLHPDGAGPAVANLLTGSRALAAAGLAVLLAVAGASGSAVMLTDNRTAWSVAAILGAITLTDFFDGRIARRLGSGRFGATWDMECDAIYVMALSLYLRFALSAPVVVLAIGLMRYLYVLIFRYDGDPAGVPRIYKLYAKTVTALIVIGLVGCMVPFVPHAVRTAVVGLLLALQLLSFAWDAVLQRHLSP